jgi:hypothetical protein
MQGASTRRSTATRVAEMVGWLPLLQGPATPRRDASTSRPRRAVPAVPVRVQPDAGLCDRGERLKFRFYTNDARIETAPGVAYEVAHPYSSMSCKQLDYWQSEDVLYLAGAGSRRRSCRAPRDTFALADLDLKDGPIEIGNSDEALTVAVSATTARSRSRELRAIFAPTTSAAVRDRVAKDFNDVPSGSRGSTIAVGQDCAVGRARLSAASRSGRLHRRQPARA